MITTDGKKHRIIFHVDMDAFFASCEEAVNPSLRGKPLVVGGTKEDKRGIVSCPNYEARAFGVRTAMPLNQAMKLVPHANFIRSTRGIYSRYSKSVREIFYKYTPLIQPVSIDEAYLDVTEVLHDYKGDYLELAKALKKEINDTLDITCTIGVAKNKFCAKMASKFKKPDGLNLVPFGKEKEWLAKTPVQQINGVGKSTFEKLQRLEVNLIEDIFKYDAEFYESNNIYGEFLLKAANGEGSDLVQENGEERKSLSKENTFHSDTNDPAFLKAELFYLMERCCFLMRAEEFKARCITIKVKYTDFTVNQRSLMKDSFSNLEEYFYDDAVKLMNGLIKKKIRLLGVKFSDLTFDINYSQENLFSDNSKNELITTKLDSIRNKYKFDIIKYGKNFGFEDL